MGWCALYKANGMVQWRKARAVVAARAVSGSFDSAVHEETVNGFVQDDSKNLRDRYTTGLAEGLASRPSVARWKSRPLGQNSASAASLCST